MSKIAGVYKGLYTIEKAIENCKCIHATTKGGMLGTEAVNMTRFSSAKLTRAYNHIQSARIYASSICRIFGEVTPYLPSYTGGLNKEKNEVLDTPIEILQLDTLAKENQIANPELNKEAICLAELRKLVAHHPKREGLFYNVLTLIPNLKGAANKKEEVNPIEIEFLTNKLLGEIQDACNLMGLRYGELIEQSKK